MSQFEPINPSDDYPSSQAYWRENSGRWYVHSALQEWRDTGIVDRDPHAALSEVAFDPRADVLDESELAQAVGDQFLRFQSRRPRGVKLIVSKVTGTYKERIWGNVGEDY